MPSGLRALARDRNGAKLFYHLASYQRNMRVTHVDNLAKGAGLEEQEVRDALSKLVPLKLGRLVIGRHGRRTRFEWDAPLIEVAAIATGAVGADELNLEDSSWIQDAEPGDEVPVARIPTKSFSVPLTNGRHASLEVPVPLSKADVAKIHRFIDLFLD